MKNDALLKSFAKKGIKAVSTEQTNPKNLKLSPLDSGQLVHIKGGENGGDKIAFGN